MKILSQDSGRVNVLMSFLEESNGRIRLYIVKFLRVLLSIFPHLVDSVILANPFGVSRLVDTLADPREFIRNGMCISYLLP